VPAPAPLEPALRSHQGQGMHSVAGCRLPSREQQQYEFLDCSWNQHFRVPQAATRMNSSAAFCRRCDARRCGGGGGRQRRARAAGASSVHAAHPHPARTRHPAPHAGGGAAARHPAHGPGVAPRRRAPAAAAGRVSETAPPRPTDSKQRPAQLTTKRPARTVSLAGRWCWAGRVRRCTLRPKPPPRLMAPGYGCGWR
jgi:hypothetical protein